MNKAIYICAAMALMLASCSNDETVELAKEKGISFRGVVGLNTRALNTTQDILEGNGMYVTTFDKDGNVVYPETHYELSGGVWMANPAQSWGGNSTLSFILTSPKLDEFSKGYTLPTHKRADTYVTEDEEIPAQKDYVVAHLTDVSKTDGSVSVSLKHVFSSIEIWAKNTNNAFKYKVKGIRLCGVNKTGCVSFTAAEAICYGLVDTKTYELTYDTPVTLNNDPQSLMGTAGNAILPPQAPLNETYKDVVQKWQLESPADAKSTYISVLINLTATAGAVIYPAGSTADNETNGWVSVPVSYEWESGKKYVYTLDFSDGAGRVDPNDPGNDVDAGGKDPDKAQPVLGGLIKFGLTVTEWNQDRNNVDLKDDSKFSATVDGWEDETTDDTILK